LAALGVVLSLAFVGYEIRQNTQLSRAAAIQGQAELSAEIILSWIEDDEALSLLTRILNGALPSEFTEHENQKLRLMCLVVLRNAENRYRQRALGVLDRATVLGGSASILSAPYLSARWDTLRSAVAPDFAERFEEEYGIR
jgi:hypothetical protein